MTLWVGRFGLVWNASCGSLAGVVKALAAVVFPPRCAACDTPLPVRAWVSLCEVCAEGLNGNVGLRCWQCDDPEPESDGPPVRFRGAELATGSAGRGFGGNDEGAANTCLCRRCRERPPPFASVVAPWLYGGTVGDLILRAKFSHREDIARGLGELLLEGLADRLGGWSVAGPLGAQSSTWVVPVPLGRRRRRQRGFNQARVIASVVAARLGSPVVDALRRRRDTVAQMRLDWQARRSNVAEAFIVTRRVGLRGRRVILVDDVVTSTETVRQAAEALRRAGVERVDVLAVARAARSG